MSGIERWGIDMSSVEEIVYFSPSTCGAYLSAVHGEDMPTDVVPIPASRWQALLSELAISAKKVSADAAGNPVLIDPPPLAHDELEAVERTWRDYQLTLTDPLISRHRDELELDGATSLSLEQYAELQVYRRALRDWPQTGDFPLSDHRPGAPAWLPEHI
ncbi:tail fiber assembly protein [Pseudomonas sp. microsymbiont 2]